MAAAIDTLALRRANAGWCWATWPNSAPDADALHARHRRSARSERASTACSRSARWSRRTVAGLRCATREHFADKAALIAALRERTACRRHRAGEGLALGAAWNRWSPRCSTAMRGKGGASMLLELALTGWHGIHGAFRLFQYITFRTIMAALTALAVSLRAGPGADPPPGRDQGRPGDPQRRSADRIWSKAGTPTMGGVLILAVGRVVHVAVGRPAQSLRVGRAGRDAGVRRDRFLRRLPQAGAARQPRGWPARWKYFWQSVFGLGAALFLYCTHRMRHRCRRRHALYVPLFKQVAIPLGAVLRGGRVFHGSSVSPTR